MENDIYRKRKEEKKHGLLLNKKGRKLFIMYAVSMIFFAGAAEAFAAGDPIKVVNNLYNFIFGLIRAI